MVGFGAGVGALAPALGGEIRGHRGSERGARTGGAGSIVRGAPPDPRRHVTRRARDFRGRPASGQEVPGASAC
ncbi:hypothetical protein METBIDRAFT_31432 [Metschnikowia bicuspidata var. bicuspidata NRRL YB-4993]|uniref:Uncharacterized protein n=1 Tax=Metschnikowia bicuspidata var. bicuspidata NRRL YB-4993 TaxID=869754 RepID=A0A1A0HF78_9ASCO|nr:hypothetical protein METBIDRAFT_31432 [Metschnikowia bicuspidata var. bicuspidata NRRL YB-4993]OBA22547.1 hypothetical protein METBIDRAFT_31432 [Metschnikowia bicuspidata var. bicuspidata NRRL YB-4993]